MSIVFFVSVTLAELWIGYHFWMFRWYAVLVFAVYATFTHYHGGLDRYLLSL